MSTISLRAYQRRISDETIEKGNTIVVLPTGAGKTLIAADVIAKTPGKALFFVPTRLLVAQQAGAIRNYLKGRIVGEYMGDMAFPAPGFEILVTTPSAFALKQASTGMDCIAWEVFSVIVFDEVHHVLKEHPYRKLAKSLEKAVIKSGKGPLILGLTASLSYAVGSDLVEKDIKRICLELSIVQLQSATADEMRREGYHATNVAAQVMRPFDLSVSIAGVVPVCDRKPHEMLQKCMDRIQKGTATICVKLLFECIREMEAAIPGFASPLGGKIRMDEWSDVCHGKGLMGCKLHAALEHWYEALRLLVVTWEEAVDAVCLFLKMTHVAGAVWPVKVVDAMDRFWKAMPTSFPRMDNMKRALIDEHNARQNGFRGLLFVNQRVMTHILNHFILTDLELNTRFKSACVYAAKSKATPSLSVSASIVRSNMTAFASGSVNLLITTVVAEEGMDVPEANVVIRFDPMLNAVSFVQGRGRARQSDSSFLVLDERADRTAAKLADVEQHQLTIVRGFRPDQVDVEAERAKAKASQHMREKSADATLQLGFDANTVVSLLNQYCSKTKVDLVDAASKAPCGRWRVCLSYASCVRAIQCEGLGQSTRDAKRAAANDMVFKLREATKGL